MSSKYNYNLTIYRHKVNDYFEKRRVIIVDFEVSDIPY